MTTVTVAVAVMSVRPVTTSSYTISARIVNETIQPPGTSAAAYGLKFEFFVNIRDKAWMIPPGRSLRVVGDVHGDSKAFAIAADTDHFIVQLGDLVDDGPDTPGALEIMFRLIDAQRGLFVLGNHDFKLMRALRGDEIRIQGSLGRTLSELSPAMAARAAAEIARAPAWVLSGNRFFVHGGFHPAMLVQPPPAFPATRPDALLARAIYGQTTGRVTGAGKPERLLNWVDDIPADVTLYCGHDRRSYDGRPLVKTGAKGGKAVFLDTGAGKGGHLSWIDIPAERVSASDRSGKEAIALSVNIG